MYTEDDKSKNNKFNIHSNNFNNQSSTFEEDYYKDYYNNYHDVSSNQNIKKVSNEVNISKTPFSRNNNDLSKRKYFVIIIILFIVLSILLVFLIQTINIKSPPVGITKNYIRLINNELELSIGEREKIDFVLSKNDDENYKIEWFSNNDSVVTVDRNGNILAVNKGEAIILVAYYINNKVYDAQCRIYVS